MVWICVVPGSCMRLPVRSQCGRSLASTELILIVMVLVLHAGYLVSQTPAGPTLPMPYTLNPAWAWCQRLVEGLTFLDG